MSMLPPNADDRNVLGRVANYDSESRSHNNRGCAVVRLLVVTVLEVAGFGVVVGVLLLGPSDQAVTYSRTPQRKGDETSCQLGRTTFGGGNAKCVEVGGVNLPAAKGIAK